MSNPNLTNPSPKCCKEDDLCLLLVQITVFYLIHGLLEFLCSGFFLTPND